MDKHKHHDEKQQEILGGSNRSDHTTTLVDLFEQKAKQMPDATALVFGRTKLSYADLDKQSSQLGAYLQQQFKIGANDLVAINLERSELMVTAVLGVLKSGAAFLPVDHAYPRQRIDYIVKDSGSKLVIDEEMLQMFSLKRARYSSSVITRENTADSTAYCIYTSGSTGKPKGVLVDQKAIINYVESGLASYINEGQGGSGSYMHMSLAFDASLTALFVTLLAGKTLVISSAKDPLEVFNDVNLVKYAPYDFIKLTPAQLALLENAEDEKARHATSRYVLGGEALYKYHYKFLKDDGIPATIINEYGPTEATVGCISYAFNVLDEQVENPYGLLIGEPMPNVEIHILDQDMKELAQGEKGEIYIGGVQLAKAYLGRPELYDEKFVQNPFSKGSCLYRSGDIGAYNKDGLIEYWGRQDEQVKILGNRVELGEIESALQNMDGIKRAVVLAVEDTPGQKRLVAYVQSSSKSLDNAAIRAGLSVNLPSFMVPASYVAVDEFPLTTNGKVDKEQLLKMDNRHGSGVLFRKPVTGIEVNIAGLWESLLGAEQVGLDDNFFELGGNSLLSIKMVAQIKQKFGYVLPVTKLYQYPSIGGISKYLEEQGVQATAPVIEETTKKHEASDRDIAIIGMAGKFPGARNLEELWDVLKDGRETVSFFTKEELDSSIPEHIKNDPDFVAAKGLIEDADKFDAEFFGMNPRVASFMDPQHRVFMEIVWEVLEKTGYQPGLFDGTVGVYAGTADNTYFVNNIVANRQQLDTMGMFQVRTLNEKDYIASRTSYQLNLRGPAVSVHSACSSSLLAVSQAVESLRIGQCDIAVAGGVSVTSPIKNGHIYQEGAILSTDGHCRPFDAKSSGTVFSDGGGVVLLKKLGQAEKDGDEILAIIKGIGLNNDGGDKGSFTAPNAEGQAGAIRMAMRDSGFDAASVNYIEAHGTGTPLGDPIEIEGLKMAFGSDLAKQSCVVGSIKSNFGHLQAASGVAGLIKTIIAMKHGQLPPTAGYTAPNPNINFTDSPFRVSARLEPWHVRGKRRAGVSSFGVGGTNVHMLIEEYTQEAPASVDTNPVVEQPYQLIAWSAKSLDSRDAYAQRLCDYIRRNPQQPLSDMAYSLLTAKTGFNHRRFVVASSSDDFLNQVLLENVSGTDAKSLTEIPRDVVFSFPGQGAQYLNMGKDLYDREPVFRAAIDECAQILESHLKLDIRKIIYTSSPDGIAEEELKNTKYTQPAIFITEYAMAKLWMSWGIKPGILCGHSIGEFVAAHLSGVFTLEDALKLIATRGRMVSELPKGSMLSVRLELVELRKVLPAELSVAAINNKKLCVVAGTDEHIAMFSKTLDGMDIPNKVLVTSHAFHSAMMDPVIDDFRQVVSQVKLNKPSGRIISSVSGTWMQDAQATDPQYWADHLRKTVRFADVLDVVSRLDSALFLEVGPGNVTSTLARQQIANKKISIMSSMERSSSRSEYYTVLKALGQLWLNGLQPDWQSFYAGQKRRRLALPTYAFTKIRCWIEPAVPQQQALVADPPIIDQSNTFTNIPTQQNTQIMRKEALFDKIKQMLEDASGLDMAGVSPGMSFIEIGLDSLLLTQMALTFKKEFKLPITFRQLNEAYSSPALLIEYLDKNLPADAYATSNARPAPQPVAPVMNTNSNPAKSANADITTLAQQLHALSQQIANLQNGNVPGESTPPQPQVVTPLVNEHSNTVPKLSDLSAEEAAEIKKPFGATARIDRHKTVLTDMQADFLEKLKTSYNLKTAKSKKYNQDHRAHMSDPRVVSGFKPLTKEIVYPIVINKSSGSRLWDIDGNEYIDALNGFGANMLGWQPEFIKKAMHEQIDKGYEVGPQHELAGEVCELICEMTGHERAALCSTGSEAVLGAMRIARTVTGRSVIVAFSGSYHGIVDEVLVRGTKKLKSFPAASGIMPEAVQNMLVLDYGTDESLKIIAERAHEIAAVLVEPVQSRRPEFAPVDFLRQVRKISAETGVLLIFDEIITGFRMHQGGAQAAFGIRADIATYGKVVGAGIPIGVIAGNKTCMDALDGGFWRYGDESFPESGVTYFAGTFVRHPLALASAKASLSYMKEKGPQLQENLAARAKYLADTLNAEFTKLGLPMFVAQYGSLWKLKNHDEIPYSELLFTLMREKGIHIWDGFPCYITEAHTDAEVDTIIRCMKESIYQMIDAGFFIARTIVKQDTITHNNGQGKLVPPVPGAKLGRDANGNPAWFVSNPAEPGKYLQLNIDAVK